MSEHLNSTSFSDCLHTIFEIQTSETERLPLELISVTERTDSPKLEQFSLVFRGQMSPVLAQRIHSIQHETLGSLELFLVPLGHDGTGMCYECVFNRFRRDFPATP